MLVVPMNRLGGREVVGNVILGKFLDYLKNEIHQLVRGGDTMYSMQKA